MVLSRYFFASESFILNPRSAVMAVRSRTISGTTSCWKRINQPSIQQTTSLLQLFSPCKRPRRWMERGEGTKTTTVLYSTFKDERDTTPPSAPSNQTNLMSSGPFNITELTHSRSLLSPPPTTNDPINSSTTTKVATSILSMDPEMLEIKQMDKDTNVAGDDSDYAFVKMFRGSANYIATHRNSVIVFHLPGEFLEDDYISELMDDIALTWLLGMKIVLVVGCRHQINKRILSKNNEDDATNQFLPFTAHNLRVTTLSILRYVKEEAGYARFEIERQLNRALKSHCANVEEGGNVISGNFYAAQPFGVVDGVDYEYTGIMRRVEVEKIRTIHEMNDVVLLTSLGASPSGEVFNVNSESLAAGVAGALKAQKIIFFSRFGGELRHVESDNLIQSLRLSDAKRLMSYHDMEINRRGYAIFPNKEMKENDAVTEFLVRIGWSTNALERGVKRAHIISPEKGSLLQELYTRDGAGTLISRDLYEGIRRATVDDVAGIYNLIQPLVKMGTLVDRPKSVLEEEILSYYVFTRDDLIVACGQLKRYEGGFAEIGCLVVNKDYRKEGRGDAMLSFLERVSLQSGAQSVFVLSTQTMHWFLERGFREVTVEALPPSRRAKYNYQRRSKIYMKTINSRLVDAAELNWDR